LLFSFILNFIKYIPGEGDEDVLIQRCLDGDKKAERILAERYLSRVTVSVSYKLEGNPKEDIEDIIQDVLTAVFSSLDKLKEKSKFPVWIYRIVHNHCVDYLKRQSRQHERIPLESEHPKEGVELPSEYPLPDELIEREELSQQVRRAILKLPLNYREVIVLRELEGLSYQQIAETLSIEVSTVKSSLYEARKQLQKKLRRIFPQRKG